MSSHRTITTKQTIYYSEGSSTKPQTVVRETTYSQRGDGSRINNANAGQLQSAPKSWGASSRSSEQASPQVQSSTAPTQHASYSSPRTQQALFKPMSPRSREAKTFPHSKGLEEIKQSGVDLWEDPDFPAVAASVFSRQNYGRNFEWKRPHEICSEPKFVSGGVSRFDIQQGELGDCWLLAAVANMTLHPELVAKVIPMDPPQSFEKPHYCGAFRFNFWYYGEWKEVVVDDRLPTYNNRLIFMHSAENNEFWSALLEKAYAKLVGSYENLKGGTTAEAMTDFTGGFCETFELREKAPKSLLQIMMKAHERKSLMGCSVNQQGGMSTEARLSNGLVMGHAYSVTGVKLIQLRTGGSSGKLPLVRVRNPWGNEAEWKGAWSDGSREWNLLSESERQEHGITFDSDGEFFMSFQDFVNNFETLEICHVNLDNASGTDEEDRFRWQTAIIGGDWKKRVNAGGCRNYLQTFWTNPQFRITVNDPDEGDEDDMCSVLVGLLQKDRRKQRSQGFDYLTIGFSLYKLQDQNGGPLEKSFFERNASVARTTFINLREVSGRFRVPPGSYVVIPSTFEPGHDGDFVCRIYTETPNTSNEIDDENALEAPTINVPPPSANETKAFDEAIAFFKRAAGDDDEVDARELMTILNSTFAKGFNFSGFTVETTRSIVALHDADMSGKLCLEEFSDLWDELRSLKASFIEHDKDRSGKLQSIELREALRSCGFRLNNKLLKALILRYADKEGNMDLDDYICCAIRLQAMISKFKKSAGRERALIASMTLDDFVLTTMYC